MRQFSHQLSRRAVCSTPRLRLTLAVAAVIIGLAATESAASAQNGDVAAYAEAIQKARAELDEGRSAEALKLLGATDESLRSFEFSYLEARAEHAAVDGRHPDLIQSLPKPEGVQVRYGVLNASTRDVVFICRDGGLRRYDLAALDDPVQTVSHPDGEAVWRGVFSNDGTAFFSGHQNGDVIVWDAETWKPRQTISLGDKPIRELAAAPDGSAFLAEGPDELELWSLAGDAPKKVAGVGDRFNFGEGLAFSPQGDLVATGGMFDVLLHDAATGEKQGTMSHASYTMGLLFSPDGKRIASAPRGNVNKFLAVFDIGSEQRLFNAGPFGNYIAGMTFTPDGKRVAATGCEKMLRVFDSETGDIVLTLPRPECGAVPAFTHDGLLLGWSEPDGFHFIDLSEADAE